VRRIRTKLVLSLLVVTLIPVVPTYFVVKWLVHRSFDVAFTENIETALEEAARIPRGLYSQYREETLEFSARLARSEEAVALLNGGGIPDLGDELTALGNGKIDVYDTQARLVASFAKLEEGAPEEEAGGVEHGSSTDRLDTRGPSASREGDLSELNTQTLDELSQRVTAEILEGGDDPQFISVCAPVISDGERHGFLIVVRALDPDFAHSARRIVAANQEFKRRGFHSDELKSGFLNFFLCLCLAMAILAGGVGYFFSRRITSPLLALVRGTQVVAAGDLDYRIDISSRDEIGQLMTAFNEMIADIKENQRLARERELARLRIEEENQKRARDLETAELKARALQAENERQTVELEKTEQLEAAYQELEESLRQLQEAQAQLILQEKMASLGAMVAGVAHEINNPIGAVHSAVDVSRRCIDRIEAWLARDPSPTVPEKEAPLRQAVDVLKANVGVTRQAEERITTLVQSLRNFARLDEAEFQMADLRDGLDSTLSLLHQQLVADITVRKKYEEIPLTFCSPGQLNQVFMSVLKNAVQAIEGRGEIAVSTSAEAGGILVQIRDTGVGIPAEKIDTIFDLEFSAKSSRVKMGSGLSMAYRIVQEHEGEICVESELGVGTEISIRLPVRVGRQG